MTGVSRKYQDHRCGLAGAKMLAVSVPALVSLFVWWSLGSALPPRAGALLLVVVAATVSAPLVPAAEPVVVALLFGGRRMGADEVRLILPVKTLLKQAGATPSRVQYYAGAASPGVPAVGVGRRSVVIDRALLDALDSSRITSTQAAVLIAPAAALVTAGATRSDVALGVWILPWTALRTVGVALLRLAGLTGLLRLGWRARWVVLAVAIVQAVQDGRPSGAVLICAIGAITYAWPHQVVTWRARLVEVGDAGAQRVRGHGGALGSAVPEHDQPHHDDGVVTGDLSGSAACAVNGRPRLTLVR